MENNKISNEKRPFVALYDDFLESDLFDWNEKRIFILLKKYADSDDKCALSVETLCGLSQLSKNTVLKALKGLGEKGAISIERRKDKDSGNMCDLYTLHDEQEIWDPDSKEGMNDGCQQEFLVIDHGFLKSKKLDLYEKMVLIALKTFADSNNQCSVGVKALVGLTGISEKKIRTVISGLVKKGVIAKENRTRPDGGRDSNLYTLYDDAGMWDAGGNGSDGDAGSGKEEMDDQQLIAALNAKGYIVTNKKGVVSGNPASGSGTRSSAK